MGEPLKKMLKDPRVAKVILVGHSLGGAVATIVALMIMKEYGSQANEKYLDKLKCITFASPLVISSDAKDRLTETDLERAKEIFHNYVHEGDMIPKLLLMSKKLLDQFPEEWANAFKEVVDLGVAGLATVTAGGALVVSAGFSFVRYFVRAKAAKDH